MTKYDWESRRGPERAVIQDSIMLERWCTDLRREAESGDSGDQFQAELLCVYAWVENGFKNPSGNDIAISCARRMLLYEVDDPYVALYAATTILHLRRDHELALQLVSAGIAATELDLDLPNRYRTVINLLVAKLSILIAIDPNSEDSLTALSELADMTHWWTASNQELISILELMSAKGTLPYTAMPILSKIWCDSKWLQQTSGELDDKIIKSEVLIGITEQNPLLIKVKKVEDEVRKHRENPPEI